MHVSKMDPLKGIWTHCAPKMGIVTTGKLVHKIQLARNPYGDPPLKNILKEWILCKFILNVLVWSLQKSTIGRNGIARVRATTLSAKVDAVTRAAPSDARWEGGWGLKMCFAYAHCAPTKRIAIALRRGQASNAPPCRCVLQASCCQPLGQSLDGGSAAWGSKRRLQRIAPPQKTLFLPQPFCLISAENILKMGWQYMGFSSLHRISLRNLLLLNLCVYNITTQTTKTL